MQKVVKDRFDIIRKYVSGRTVLDMGCMEYSKEQAQRTCWLHRKIALVAGDTVGVDILGDRTGDGRYRILRADVQSSRFGLRRKFDVIVAGELIEHMSDQRTFLNNVSRHLRKGGIFIVTTPNAFSLGGFLRRILRMHRGITTARGHVLVHDELTLRGVLEMHGFRVLEIIYWQIESYGKKKFFSPLLHIWPDMATNIIAVATI